LTFKTVDPRLRGDDGKESGDEGKNGAKFMTSKHKKNLTALLLICLSIFIVSSVNAKDIDNEFRAVWVYFSELGKKGVKQNEADFVLKIDNMFSNIQAQGFNNVFVHVRANSDAMYKSKYFPWSMYISGKQGVDPGYDPLKIMIDAAHKRGIKFHAWINPLRGGRYEADIVNSNPVLKWYKDIKKRREGWVIKVAEKNSKTDYIGLFYNPAIPEVRKLIVDGVKEIVQDYDVDGIHFDDYFYPTANPLFDQAAFNHFLRKPENTLYEDLNELERSKLPSFRRKNVNKLIREVYKSIKIIKPMVAFSISPCANIGFNFNTLYADVYTWLSEPGYVDGIIPQIYFGFEYGINKLQFMNCSQEWSKLVKLPTIKLYFGLGFYKSGTVDDNSKEWQEHTDIIKRQILYLREISNYSGFAIFSYSDIVSNEPHHIAERLSYLPLL
jgi:uncharacterized lipoprotein YddW (UPF0748 family)